MTKLLIHGCNGRMGNMIAQVAKNYPEIEIVAGVDKTGDSTKEFPVYTNLGEVKEAADVMIDFSTAAAADGLLKYINEKNMPSVICTTGLSEEQIERLKETSKKVPILRSGNMSMGINTLLKILESVSCALTNAGFDVEVVEKHHKTKIDAPSGTAIMLADAVCKGTGHDYEYVYDRTQRREVRPKEEIGISSIRGGTIVGEHDVIFAGTDEIIEIKHTALSRAVFANGALNAAMFLKGKEAGLYTMADVIG